MFGISPCAKNGAVYFLKQEPGSRQRQRGQKRSCFGAGLACISVKDWGELRGMGPLYSGVLCLERGCVRPFPVTAQGAKVCLSIVKLRFPSP